MTPAAKKPETSREPFPYTDFIHQTCARRHHWVVTKVEWEAYKGELPMPCPVCIRLGHPLQASRRTGRVRK